MGIYSITWVFQVLYHIQPISEQRSPIVTGTISKFEGTGVDAENVVICTFPKSIGVASSSIRVSTGPVAVRIYGTKGEIQVSHPAYRPTSVKIITRAAPVDGPEKTICKDFPQPGGAHGMMWEADEAARCLRDGKLQCEIIPVAESILVMEAMDQVGVSAINYKQADTHTPCF